MERALSSAAYVYPPSVRSDCMADEPLFSISLRGVPTICALDVAMRLDACMKASALPDMEMLALVSTPCFSSTLNHASSSTSSSRCATMRTKKDRAGVTSSGPPSTLRPSPFRTDPEGLERRGDDDGGARGTTSTSSPPPMVGVDVVCASVTRA